MIEVRFGNALNARGYGNRARIAEVSGDHAFADHACLKLPRRLSDHLVGCKLSLTSVYLHTESKPRVRLSADEQVFAENILHFDN